MKKKTKNMMRIRTILSVVAMTAIVVSSCSSPDKEKRAIEYMPDMYRGPGIETYGMNPVMKDSMGTQLPVEGTIPRGHIPYEFDNSQAGYDSAKVGLTNPYAEMINEAYLADGKELYGIFCSSCHGKSGDGQGILVKNEKILGVPSYADAGRAISEGSTYHVIMYGKGVMGSHASQLLMDERWKITNYVMQLKAELEK